MTTPKTLPRPRGTATVALPRPRLRASRQECAAVCRLSRSASSSLRACMRSAVTGAKHRRGAQDEPGPGAELVQALAAGMGHRRVCVARGSIYAKPSIRRCVSENSSVTRRHGKRSPTRVQASAPAMDVTVVSTATGDEHEPSPQGLGDRRLLAATSPRHRTGSLANGARAPPSRCPRARSCPRCATPDTGNSVQYSRSPSVKSSRRIPVPSRARASWIDVVRPGSSHMRVRGPPTSHGTRRGTRSHSGCQTLELRVWYVSTPAFLRAEAVSDSRGPWAVELESFGQPGNPSARGVVFIRSGLPPRSSARLPGHGGAVFRS